MLSQTQRQELRRILGYPALAQQASVQLGYPGYASAFAQWQPYAWLESRFTTLAPGEEVEIFGQESLLFSQFLIPASVAFTVSTPSAIANAVTLTFNVAGTTVAVASGASDTPATFAAKCVTALAANTTVEAELLLASAGPTLTLTAITAGIVGNGTSISVVSSDPSLQISLAAPAGGTTVPAAYAFGMTQGGADPPGEKYILPDQPLPVYGYVSFVRILEGDLGNARKFLYFVKAGDFNPRGDEIAARKAMLRHYRMKIAERLNVPLDPDLVGNSKRSGFRRI
jgi:hypothetical protein